MSIKTSRKYNLPIIFGEKVSYHPSFYLTIICKGNNGKILTTYLNRKQKINVIMTITNVFYDTQYYNL